MIKQINTDDKNYLESIKAEDIVIKDFRKLRAYQLSLELIKKIIVIANKLPKYETYVLKDQIIRASYGVSAQIAEGNGGLYTKREIQFCSTATASLCEAQAWLDICLLNNYITREEQIKIEKIAIEIKSLLVTYVRGFLQ